MCVLFNTYSGNSYCKRINVLRVDVSTSAMLFHAPAMLRRAWRSMPKCSSMLQESIRLGRRAWKCTHTVSNHGCDTRREPASIPRVRIVQ